jgi:hypothetical protein
MSSSDLTFLLIPFFLKIRYITFLLIPFFLKIRYICKLKLSNIDNWHTYPEESGFIICSHAGFSNMLSYKVMAEVENSFLIKVCWLSFLNQPTFVGCSPVAFKNMQPLLRCNSINFKLSLVCYILIMFNFICIFRKSIHFIFANLHFQSTFVALLKCASIPL